MLAAEGVFDRPPIPYAQASIYYVDIQTIPRPEMIESRSNRCGEGYGKSVIDTVDDDDRRLDGLERFGHRGWAGRPYATRRRHLFR